jgi:hypothetical protein
MLCTCQFFCLDFFLSRVPAADFSALVSRKRKRRRRNNNFVERNNNFVERNNNFVEKNVHTHNFDPAPIPQRVVKGHDSSELKKYYYYRSGPNNNPRRLSTTAPHIKLSLSAAAVNLIKVYCSQLAGSLCMEGICGRFLTFHKLPPATARWLYT